MVGPTHIRKSHLSLLHGSPWSLSSTYRNAKLTLDYLFDVSQTTGKEIHPTDWQLSDEMKKALTERLSYAHGFPKQDFPQALYAMASESVAENYNHFLQELKQETKGHLFTEIPAGGFEAQYIQLLTDSISYFIGKKCHLSDEEIQLSDGMATVSHFILLENVPGLAPTSLLLLEQLRTIDRKRLRGYIGRISKEKMLEVDAALAISIGIGYPNERRTHNV